MKERPILFSAPMVRAILEGQKTQTRRVVTCRDGTIPIDFYDGMFWFENGDACVIDCPHGVPGDRLWVREAWRYCCANLFDPVQAVVQYAADDAKRTITLRDRHQLPKQPKFDADPQGITHVDEKLLMRWWAQQRPSIHMPRWASRITLEITAVRVERVQDISEADARAEGARCADRATGREVMFPDESQHIGSWKLHFRELWDSINAKRGFCWDANPWVWVIEFKRVST